MHITLLATVSTAPAIVTQESETEWETLTQWFINFSYYTTNTEDLNSLTITTQYQLGRCYNNGLDVN